MRARLAIVVGIGSALAVVVTGCGRPLYVPSQASPPYPVQLHQAASADIQVFRDGQSIDVVNSTARSYPAAMVWINQRYVRSVDALPAGQTVRLPLWEFFDERGERFNAGGFWRTEEATPVRLVELQISEDQPMVGLVLVQD